MLDPETGGNSAGIVNICPRTAGPLDTHRLTMVVKLERDADNIKTLFFEERRGNLTVNPA